MSGVKGAARRASDVAWTEMQRLVNRFRHDKLQARLADQLRELGRPQSILVVCTANLCRSPYLEAVLRRNFDDVEVKSAGILGAGRRVPSEWIAAALDRGVDLSGHRSQLLNGRMLERSNLIVVMEPRQARMLTRVSHVAAARIVVAGDLDSEADEPRQIIDPWGRSRAVGASTLARLDRCAHQLTLMLPPAEKT